MPDDVAKPDPHSFFGGIRTRHLEYIDILKDTLRRSRDLLDELANRDAPPKIIAKQQAFVAEYEHHLEKAEADLAALDEESQVLLRYLDRLERPDLTS